MATIEKPSILYSNKNYQVETSVGRSIIGEDGKYTTTHEGYCVVNKDTGVVEHSSTILPGVIFQCDHFNDSLESLLNPQSVDEETILSELNVPDDIVPN